jgi:hypothetical protein
MKTKEELIERLKEHIDYIEYERLDINALHSAVRLSGNEAKELLALLESPVLALPSGEEMRTELLSYMKSGHHGFDYSNGIKDGGEHIYNWLISKLK